MYFDKKISRNNNFLYNFTSDKRYEKLADSSVLIREDLVINPFNHLKLKLSQ